MPILSLFLLVILTKHYLLIGLAHKVEAATKIQNQYPLR